VTSRRLTLPPILGGGSVPIALPIPIGLDKRCTADGLPNNFGIHNDKPKPADSAGHHSGLGVADGLVQ